jgi:predicted DNA-binding protein YlxM (UPF0122 family)
MSTIEIAKKFKISQPAVSRLSRRGEKIEKEEQVELIPNRNARNHSCPLCGGMGLNACSL